MRAQQVKELIQSGLFEYGSRMSIEDFGRLDDIVAPNINMMNGRDAIQADATYKFSLLSLYGDINEQLMAVGRKLVLRDGEYVVPTVADTLDYVEQYEKQAKAKNSKARKLYRNFVRLHPQYVQPEEHRVKQHANRAVEMQVENMSGPAY